MNTDRLEMLGTMSFVTENRSVYSRRKFSSGILALAGLYLTTTGGESRQEYPQLSSETEEPLNNTKNLENPAILHRAEQIISTFENSTTEIRYNYVENLGDGRGITAGRAGFTSGTGDLLQVIEIYVEMGGEGTALAELLPALRKVNGTESVEGLENFVAAWDEAINENDILIKAQDDVYHGWYLDPALERAKELGVNTAIGQTIILDTIIQHGEGEDIDGLPYIINETIEAIGRADGQEEKWLNTFLDIRESRLKNAADEKTRTVWAKSIDRVQALRSILESGNVSLDPPIEWTVYGDSFSIS